MNEINFNIFMRKPRYPVIIVSKNKLYSAFNTEQLAKSCVSSMPIDNRTIVQVIDCSGEEFWYSPEQNVLGPGFAPKKWTKKQLIEIFNNSSNAKIADHEYSTKSLSGKKLDKIINDICELLQ